MAKRDNSNAQRLLIDNVATSLTAMTPAAARAKGITSQKKRQ